MGSRSKVTKALVSEVQSKCKHPLSAAAVEGRLRRGWSEDRIINTGYQVSTVPDVSHPYKRKSYEVMAKRRRAVK